MNPTADDAHRSTLPLPRKEEQPPRISVVAPVYNEEDCLEALHARLSEVLSAEGGDYEIVLVDDGSHDRSLEIIRRLAAEDPHVGYLALSRNFGHEAATTCGLLGARGRAVVIIDADLQDPPEVIPDLLAKWREGYDLVYAQRASREGETAVTRLTSHLFYRLLRRITPVDIPVDTGDFRLMDRAVVEAFAQLPERNRFVRGMISWTGFRQTTVRYERDARLAGDTKYGFIKRLRLAVDAVCGMTTRPLGWITKAGAAITLVSIAAVAIIAIRALLGGGESAGWGLLAAVTAFFGGVQLLAIGLLGQYVGRIHTEVQGRPLYLVAERHDAALDDRARRTGRVAG